MRGCAKACLGLVFIFACAQSGWAATVDELEQRMSQMQSNYERQLSQMRAEIEELKKVKTEEGRQIEALSEEVEQLKVFELIPELGKEGKYGLGPAASKVYGITKGVSLAGYGELFARFFDSASEFDIASGSGTTRLRDDSDLLRKVLYVGYKFSDSLIFNSEIEFEHTKTSAGPDTSAGEVSVEFATLDFLLDPKINIRAGLLLMPMGITNELHESPTYHGVFRPDTEQFIIPTTWRENGVGIFGEAFPGLEYRLYTVAGLVTNSSASGTSVSTAKFTHHQGLRGGRQQGVRSIAEELAYTARLDYKGIPGLMLGTSFYGGQAHTPQGNNLPDTSVDINLWDVHLMAAYKGFELRALYAQGNINGVERINQRANIATASGKSIGEKLFGYYAEIAYDIMPLVRPGSMQYLAPFFRYEMYDTQDGVPGGYADLSNTERTVKTLGLSYKPHPNINIKADYQFRDNGFSDTFNIGLSFMY